LYFLSPFGLRQNIDAIHAVPSSLIVHFIMSSFLLFYCPE
jgi:hypothetical protein